MILKNYWVMTAFQENQTLANVGHYNNVDIGLIDIDGNSVNAITSTNGWQDTVFNVNYVFNVDMSVRVGDDDTTPTLSDYALGNDITSHFAQFSSKVLVSPSRTDEEMLYSVSGINATDSIQIIRELIVTKKFYVVPSGSSGYIQREIALVRYVLDTPIEVQVGSGFNFAFKWIQL